eukprot:3555069-Pyramimonas_sp.AAC.1
MFCLFSPCPLYSPHPPQLFLRRLLLGESLVAPHKRYSGFLKTFWRPPVRLLGASGGFLGPPCLQPRSP